MDGFSCPKRLRPCFETSNGVHCILSDDSGRPERSAVVSESVPLTAVGVCHCCRPVFLYTWGKLSDFIANVCKFTSDLIVMSHCLVWRIQHFDQTIKRFFSCGHISVSPTSYARFPPHTQSPLKSVEAWLKKGDTLLCGVDGGELSLWFSLCLWSNWKNNVISSKE